ncbi:ATP-binding cassette domain-containing protein [Vibrio metschnikovii]
MQVREGKIEFENVSFHYGENKGVINHLNLTIKPGEKVGLVGRSELGNQRWLISCYAFHDVESGAIKIDGQNVAEVTQDSLRTAIGMVTQDTSSAPSFDS